MMSHSRCQDGRALRVDDVAIFVHYLGPMYDPIIVRRHCQVHAHQHVLEPLARATLYEGDSVLLTADPIDCASHCVNVCAQSDQL